jgi:multiple sugar transport system permease protein
MYAWQNGAEFMSKDGRTCTLNSSNVVEALEFMVSIYDKLGGAKKVFAFQSNFQSGTLDPFLTRKVAMKIDGDWFMQIIATYKPNMNFDTAPAPIPEKRLKKGFKPITWLGGWSYSIPSASKNKEGAWKIVRWLSSIKAKKMLLAEQAENNESQGRTYIPRLSCDKRMNKYAYQTYVKDSPNLSASLKKAFKLMIVMLPDAKYRPVTPVGQLLWNQHVTAYENAVYHKSSSIESLDEATKVVQKALDRIFNPPTGKIIKWKWLVLGYIGLLFSIVFGIVVWSSRSMSDRGYFRKQWYAGVLCASPWLIGFAVFTGGPILFSIIMSFCHYDILNPAQWVGFYNYKWIFTQDPVFWTALWNTLYMVAGVPLGIVIGLCIALLLDLKLKGMTFYRTLFYMPAIVPAVAASILWIWIFNPTSGLLNSIFAVFGINGPSWLQDASWSKPSLILMGLWGVGGSMIIWLAGLKNIPQHLYEAAEVDGAGVWSRFINITIPMLSPYIFFNLIMGFIGTFQIFSQAYIMTQGGPMNSTLFFAYHLFNTAFRYLDMGNASAMAWFLFVIVFSLTVFQLWLSKKWVHYESE